MSEHVEETEEEYQPGWAERNASTLTSFPAVVIGIALIFGMMIVVGTLLL